AALLATLSIAVSVALLLSVGSVRDGARASFSSAISDVDVVVGARAGGVQLMLYAVFGVGEAPNAVSWESYQAVRAHPAHAWSVPISLGDSHRGRRVIGTTLEYFERYRYRGGQRLRFAEGRPFDGLYDAVLGAETAAALGYDLGRRIVLTHGISGPGLRDHDDKPFTVVGVLAPTGTPVDRGVFVSLEAIEAIHIDWRRGAPVPGLRITAEETLSLNLRPQSITAALVGVKSPLAIFEFQRFVNERREEPMTAVLPGVALSQLWSVIGVGEQALTVIAGLVVTAALLGVATMLLATTNERRREMAILRASGARPGAIFGLLIAEATLITLMGAALGAALHYIGLAALQPWFDATFGLSLPISAPGWREAGALAGVAAAGALAGLAPAIRAYRASLADGLTVRL
ncbi:MAG: ABC transporter permease, partial [Pseudomonadota bacterium]